ncbi:MAG TPA: phosphoribosyltransferase family protein, partial [Candidatus Paceibacterota bacterium]|nr:phosphoribosyltransferase family protein [Candidatus Paceibacterota bacterium]
PRVLKLKGDQAIGHVRYSTVTKSGDCVFQPIEGSRAGENFFLAHNGNLTNRAELAANLAEGSLKTNIDSEAIVRLLEQTPGTDIETVLIEVLRKLEGSFELLILLPDEIIAVRDPKRNHPLYYGKCIDGSYVIASETAALTRLDAIGLGVVEPGTFMRFKPGVAPTAKRYAAPAPAECVFEPIYFMLTTSEYGEESVMQLRRRAGGLLEKHHPANADIVIGIPDSAVTYAEGYAASGRSGKHVQAIIRHHDGGRTFILPNEDERQAEVGQKFQWSPRDIRGKRVVLVDDSIVRSTTMRHIVARTRAVGASEVHVRIAFAPFKHRCFYGIDTADEDELIAARCSVEEIREVIKADSLEFMNIGEIVEVLRKPKSELCLACVNGQYWHKQAG